jgi:hypothetical protein
LKNRSKENCERGLSSIHRTLHKKSNKQEKMGHFPEPRYIIVGYDQEFYQSIFIKDEDVVRPPNHMHTTHATPRSWLKKSTARCPTYGSCNLCMKCGPVDEYCDKCGNGEEGRYLVPFNHGQTMDSITIAEIMNTGHKRARANRTQAWIRTPMVHVRDDCFGLALQRSCNATLTKEEQSKILHKIYGIMPE